MVFLLLVLHAPLWSPCLGLGNHHPMSKTVRWGLRRVWEDSVRRCMWPCSWIHVTFFMDACGKVHGIHGVNLRLTHTRIFQSRAEHPGLQSPLLCSCLLCVRVALQVLALRSGEMSVPTHEWAPYGCTHSGWFSLSVLRGTALQVLHSVVRTDQYCMAFWVDHVLRLPGCLAAAFP